MSKFLRNLKENLYLINQTLDKTYNIESEFKYLRAIAKDHLEALQEIQSMNAEITRLTQRVRELEDANRWIPVSERLPKYDQRVFGVKNKQVIIGFVSGVTHWMPLPDVPQEGE